MDAEIGCKSVRDFRCQADDMAPPVVWVGRAYDEPRVDEPLNQTLRAARRQTGADAKRTRRDCRSFAMRDEQLDEYIPRRLAEQPVGAQQLPAQQDPSDRSPRVRERDGQSGAEGAFGVVGAGQVRLPRAQAEGLHGLMTG